MIDYLRRIHHTQVIISKLHNNYGFSLKLLIRNLPRNTTEAELLAIFTAYGAVQSCTLVLDKTTQLSKGFGFIEMPKPGEAKLAIKSLNGQDIGGNKIRVKKAEVVNNEVKSHNDGSGQ
jgi:RNA recognition motif-containing protein